MHPKHPRKSFSSTSDRPLIEHVTNEWRKNPEYQNFHDKYDEDDYGQFLSKIPAPRRLMRRPLRYLFLYLIVVSILAYTYTVRWRPRDESDIKLSMSIKYATAIGRKLGANQHVSFDAMKLLAYLDSIYLPKATAGSVKRIIFVGDVHGCKQELVDLLEKVAFKPSEDHLILLGDIVAKGPDSAGVVEMARTLGASCVRGNHEDRLLLSYQAARAPKPTMQLPVTLVRDDGTTDKPLMAEPPVPHPKDSHQISRAQLDLAATFNSDQIAYLEACPVILHVGRLGGYWNRRTYVAVHAGLAPGVALDKQDAYLSMHMRTMDLVTRVPSESKTGEPWGNVWTHFQKTSIPSEERVTVVYGHDSGRGLQKTTYTRGLDTGCVKGGQLTAMVVDEQGNESFVSVDCPTDYTLSG